MEKQPTATRFTRTQQSWAEHILKKLEGEIDERENLLLSEGWEKENLPDDETLSDLYDDELFYMRYAEEMKSQRDYIKENYL